MSKQTLASILCGLRKQMNLKQQATQDLGISRRSIYAWEHGLATPVLHHLIQLLSPNQPALTPETCTLLEDYRLVDLTSVFSPSLPPLSSFTWLEWTRLPLLHGYESILQRLSQNHITCVSLVTGLDGSRKSIIGTHFIQQLVSLFQTVSRSSCHTLDFSKVFLQHLLAVCQAPLRFLPCALHYPLLANWRKGGETV